ncbi:MAG TPA: biopolymer transporter ExbD [Gammaproteobacteria bacterium]|nr:biopolymer transporter ExbD [Gammaproteobacteria bacterium]
MIRASARHAREQANAEINMVPLIDIMLVLVIVLLVTAPLLTHAVKIDLPKASSAPNKVEPQTITLSVDAVGALYWNREKLPWKTLAPRLDGLREVSPEPEIHIRADGNTPYRKVVRVMSAVSAAGLTRIGFVTDPTERR